MRRFGLGVITVWLCLSSTARASVVPGGIFGAETKLDSFLVMCNSGERSDICTDALRFNPVEPIGAVDPADFDPILGHPGTVYGDVFANWGQEDGNSSKFSGDPTNADIAGPSPLTVVPEPGDVFAVGLCLAVFAAARLRASRHVPQE
jgi:hypothetical protein